MVYEKVKMLFNLTYIPECAVLELNMLSAVNARAKRMVQVL